MSTAEAAAVVFLDPSPEQVRLVSELAGGRDVVIVPLEDELSSEGSLRFMSAAELLASPRRENETWHCCSELAVYFASKHRLRAGRLPFDRRCFDMLTKLESAEVFAAHGLPHIPKLDPVPPFPFVAKPNFGFATRLVRRIADESEWRDYVELFDGMRESARIDFYAKEYFAHLPAEQLRRIVCEPDLSDAVFVTFVLAVEDGALQAAFGVEAFARLDNHLSDFTWGGFRAPLRWPDGVEPRMNATLEAAVSAFCTGSGVFEVEMLVDAASGHHRVLEFSPRITGGNIPRLIRHAYGVDVERANIEYALGRRPDVTRRDGRLHVLQRMTTVPSAEMVEVHKVAVDGVSYVDALYITD